MIRIITVVKLTETFMDEEVLIILPAWECVCLCVWENKHVSDSVECQLPKLLLFLLLFTYKEILVNKKNEVTTNNHKNMTSASLQVITLSFDEAYCLLHLKFRECKCCLLQQDRVASTVMTQMVKMVSESQVYVFTTFPALLFPTVNKHRRCYSFTFHSVQHVSKAC